ncbi:MAG: molybdopterin-binding oxidoreductase [Actinomycetia bacterium]|nr:molybdopterin-binding oxidoreductase [Actinomycetes bacterium]
MTTDRGTGAVAGVLAAAVGLGAAELVAGAVPTGRSPVVAVADRVIHLGPPAWEREVIRVLGTNDKPALVLIVLVALVALGALAGTWATRRPLASRAIIAAAAVVGALSALAEEDASWVHALAPVAGGLATAWTLTLLVRATEDTTSSPLSPAGADRRRFLVAGTVAASVAAVAGASGRALQGRVNAAASRQAVRLPSAAEPLPAIPAGAELGLPGLTPFVTPNKDFYRIDVSLIVPQVETSGWILRIDGMVDHPRTYTYEQLLARPLVEADVTITCVSNEVGGGLIGNARWLGVPLKELLDEVGPSAKADQLVGRSVDGFTTGMPLATAVDGRDALLAVGMNGVPLPLRHGFPARLIVAGLYGYVSATKWLRQIEVTRFDAYTPYWIERGWDTYGPIKLESRIDTPGGTVAAGRVPVAGVAWAQGRGIERVEVRVDDGAWRDAVLAEAVGADTWRQWHYDWDAPVGRHQLMVRATAGDGEVQTGDEALPFPNGATGWHTVGVRVKA